MFYEYFSRRETVNGALVECMSHFQSDRSAVAATFSRANQRAARSRFD